MKPIKAKILVVDDEPRYTNIIQFNLAARGYRVLIAHDGETAIGLAINEVPDLIILDVRMPDINGFDVCKQVRQFSTVPVIFLTALTDDVHKIQGLTLGADDYVTKPFSLGELLARVAAALRRVEMDERQQKSPVIQVGSLQLDLVQQQASLNNKLVQLTRTEFRLLKELAKQAGRIVSTPHLLEVVWGTDYLGDDRVLRQVVYRLRQKIEQDPKNPQYIRTKSGLGYFLAIPN